MSTGSCGYPNQAPQPTRASNRDGQTVAVEPRCRCTEAITGDRAAISRHACGMDLEGIVSKRIGSHYVSGRTRAWLKTKNPGYDME